MKLGNIIFLLVIISNLWLMGDESNDNLLHLSLQSAVDRALFYNLQIKKNQLEMITKKISLGASWNEFLPNTTFGFSYSTNNNSSINGTKKSSNSSGYRLNFSTSFTLNANMVFNIVQIVLDYQMGKLTEQQVKKNIVYEVKKDYYQLVLQKDEITIKEAQLNNAEELYHKNLVKYQEKIISEIDLLTSEYNYKSLIPALKSLQSDYSSTLLTFQLLLGIEDNKVLILTDTIPEIIEENYDKYYRLDLNNNLDLQQLMSQIKLNENSRNSAIASLTPSFSISYGADYSVNKQDLPTSSTESTKSIGNGLTISLHMPLDNLFPFSKGQVSIIKTQNTIKSTKYELSEQKKNFTSN